jgi:hypothetical protein
LRLLLADLEHVCIKGPVEVTSPSVYSLKLGTPQSGSAIMSCTYCYKGFALPGEPKGTMVGQDYFTAAPNDATQRTKAIVLLTDIFGLPLPNPRIIADHLAEHVGVDVWVPDFFNGAPLMISIDALLVQWLADVEARPAQESPPPT